METETVLETVLVPKRETFLVVATETTPMISNQPQLDMNNPELRVYRRRRPS